MILIKNLKLNNFLSHEDTQIEFKENQHILIDGKSGSGKSSIAEAIIWALYGNGRTSNRSLIRKGGKDARVTLELLEGTRKYRIIRSCALSGKNSLSIAQSDGEGPLSAIETTGIKSAQDWIESTLLHASYELFTNSIAYPQDNETSFVKATASRRKDLLLEIVRAGSFDEFYEKTRTELNKEQNASVENNIKVEQAIRIIENSKEEAAKVEFFETQINDLTSKIQTMKLEENAAAKKIKNIEDWTQKKILNNTSITDAVNRIIGRESQISKDLKTIQELKTIDITLARANVIKAAETKIKIDELNDRVTKAYTADQAIRAHMANRPVVNDYTDEISRINKQLIPLVSDSHKCPAGDECPFIAPIKGQIDFLSEQIKNKEDKTIMEKASLSVWEKQYEALPKGEDVSVLLDGVKMYRTEYDTLIESEKVVSSYESSLQQIERLNVAISESITQDMNDQRIVDDLKKENKNIEKSLEEPDLVEAHFMYNNLLSQSLIVSKDKEEAIRNHQKAIFARTSIEIQEKVLKDCEKYFAIIKNKIEALTELKEAFSPRGIKAVVIDYLVPELEDRINNVLCQMSDFRIRLDTQQVKADDEGVKEGMFITVINDRNEEMPFESYSGGERVKITISISEALASLMNQVGFRIMDENIVSLDKESTESFIKILADMQTKFKQLLLVSHLQEVKDMFEERIVVTKINGVSNIT